MRTLLHTALLILAVLATSSVADAAPKKYYFELAGVLQKPDVKPDVGKEAATRVEAQLKKAWAAHPQLVQLEGQPDWKASPEPYRAYLKKKGIAGAYLVTVEITDAQFDVQPMEGKPNTQRITCRIALHMLGENMPGRTMGFTGDGQATIKVEIGKKLRDADTDYAWQQAAEAAIDDAMKTVFGQLAKPQKKQ